MHFLVKDFLIKWREQVLEPTIKREAFATATAFPIRPRMDYPNTPLGFLGIDAVFHAAFSGRGFVEISVGVAFV